MYGSTWKAFAMTPNLFLLISHYRQGDAAMENCAIVTKLTKKHIMKSAIIIDILDQSVLKNELEFENEEKLMDHYFSKYKEPLAESITNFMMKAEKYPFFAKQVERYLNGKNTSN
jgi:hypothetical protein